MGSDAGGSPRVGDERVPSAHPRALSGALRDHSGELRHACCRTGAPSSADGDGVAASLQHPRPRGAGLSAHRWPPPLCPEIEAGLGETVRAAQRSAATPPVAGADPAPRWTLRRLVGWVRERFGRTCCRETIRAALHRLGLSWKKKLLGRANPERRQAFVEQIQGLLAGARHDRHLLVYLDEIHQDADLGYGWSERASGSPRPRRACRTSSRFTASISTTKVKCGCGPMPAPTARTPSMFCAGSAPNGPADRRVGWRLISSRRCGARGG